MGEVSEMERDGVEILGCEGDSCLMKAELCKGFEAELASEKVSGETEGSSGEKGGFLIEANGSSIDRPLEAADVGNGQGGLDVDAPKVEVEEVCSLTNDGSVASFGVENGIGKESEEEHSANIDVGEENEVGLSKVVTEDLYEKIEPDVAFADEVFDNDAQVGNGGENATQLVSSGSESATEVDINFCPLTVATSENWEASQTEENFKNMFFIESEMLSGECFPNEVDIEKNLVSLPSSQGVNAGLQKKQHAEIDIVEPTEVTSAVPEEVFIGDRCPLWHVEREVGSSEQGLASEAVSCSSTILASQHLPSVFNSVENCSLKPLLAADNHGSEVGAVIGLASCFSKVNSSSGESDNGGGDDKKSIRMIVCRRTNPKRSASLWSNLNEGKLDRLIRIKNNGRKCREQVETSGQLLRTVKLSDKFKRKRSSPRRPARLSIWGAVDYLIKIFEQNNRFENYPSDAIHVQSVRPKKRRTGLDRKKLLKAQKDGAQVSSATQDASSHQPMFHIAIGSSASDHVPTSTSQIDFGISDIVEHKDKFAGDGCADGARSLNGQIGDKDLESTLTLETSADYIVSECPGISSQIGIKMLLEEVNCRNALDAGTSPDSDVYNPILDALMTNEGSTSAEYVTGTLDVNVVPSEGATSTDQVIEMGESVLAAEPVEESGLHSLKPVATPLSVPSIDTELHTNHIKAKNNVEVRVQSCQHSAIEEKFHGPENLNRAGNISRDRISEQKNNIPNENSQLCSEFDQTLRKESNCKGFPFEPSVGIAELDHPEESLKVQAAWELYGQDTNNSKSEEIPPSNKIKGRKLPSSRSQGSKDKFPGTTCQRRTNVHGQKKGNARKSKDKCITEMQCGMLDASVDALDAVSFASGIAKQALAISTQFNSNFNAGSKVVPEDVPSSVVIPVGEQMPPKECESLEGQSLSPQLAWVSCDDCQKWRCISVELANVIDETNCKWTCKDNTDKAFADCSIPQEKTNSEINAELGISDKDESSSDKPISKGDELSKSAASSRDSWTAIKSNLFLHRNRKSQTIDEIMVCHCKPPRDGNLGCGEQCLNRMLNIECVKGTCPCGDLCSNQQFQKRKYVNMKKFHCGKKGCGLQLQEDACEGSFLIEYVGEVLDLASYEGRQRDYASKGQKHFYFMALNGGEVIDACVKGNLGRFVNHSCGPNCRTEKWMVNGEVCIGLFAIRDIRKGEEVTFDYNYVRVVGAAAKRCVCGSSQCRGYLGGDPLSSEVIVQGDSDDEDLEPVMNHEVSEIELNPEKAYPDANYGEAVKKEQICMKEEICILREDTLVKCTPAVPKPEVCVETKDNMRRTSADINPLDKSLTALDCIKSQCGGYLGGDPLSSEVIVQGDSDDEDLEPVMNHEVSEIELNPEKAYPDANYGEAVKKEQICILREDTLVKCTPAVPKPEVCVATKENMQRTSADINPLDKPLTTLDCIKSKDIMSRPISVIQLLGDSKECLSSIQIDDTISKPISDIQPSEVSLKTSSRVSEVLADSAPKPPIRRKSITNHAVEKPNKGKPCSNTKSSHANGKIKKSRSIARNLVSHNSKKLATGAGNGYIEGVEEKLNELLDMDGGISKQKDATRGYLKLLFVTAAEGDVKGRGFQSTRDLSLILDAILKTKSRKVLVDIIDKNGLQMLHNIMKQNRSNFTRIPIIRKLLKVLEFLALKRILTTEQINRDPPCSGMESFKESILILTRHNDIQVYQIARNFCDTWIPRTIKRVEPSNRDGGQLDLQHPHGSWFQSSTKLKCWRDQGTRDADSVGTSLATHPPSSSGEQDIPIESSSLGQGVSSFAPVTNNSSASVTGTRKRKGSRWGPPLDVPCLGSRSLQEGGVKCMKLSSARLASQHEFSKQTSLAYGEENSFCDEVASTSYLMRQNLKVEAPPGFGSAHQNMNLEAPPGFGSAQQDMNLEAPPGFGSAQQHMNMEAPPGFGSAQQHMNMEAPPGFGSAQQHMNMEAPPGFGSAHQNMNLEAPPGFGSGQQDMNLEAPPGFGSAQQHMNMEAPPGFGSAQQHMNMEAPPGFESAQKNMNMEAPPGFGSRDADSVDTSLATHPPSSSGEQDIPIESSSLGQGVSSFAPVTDNSSASVTGTRKRSRWGPPLDVPCLGSRSLQEGGVKCMKLSSARLASQREFPKQTSLAYGEENSFCDEIASTSYLMRQNLKVEAPPGFGSSQQNMNLEAPPGFGSVQQNMNMEAHPGFGSAQQNMNMEAPPGFGSAQQNMNMEAPPGFGSAQQHMNMEAPPGFGSAQQNMNMEAPPGFGSAQQNMNVEAPGFATPPKQYNTHMDSEEVSVASGQVVMGHLQERYLPHLNVSFGIPMVLMKQLGDPKTEGGSQFNSHWAVAPGVPFHPFPPLPSYPHPTQERTHSHAASCSEKNTSTTSSAPSHMSESCHRKSSFTGRSRWPSNGPARRNFHPQRCDNRTFQRCLPYLQERVGQGFRGSMRNGTSNLG